MGELARIVSCKVAWRMGKNPVSVKFIEGVEDNPVRRQPDISVARNDLAYEPTIGLEEELNRSIVWQMGLKFR